MAVETMLYEKEGHVATITLNRPERLNAINAQWLEDFEEVIESAAWDDGVRAVIITGAGRAFCAGADLHDWEGFEKLGDGLMRRSPKSGGMRIFTQQLQNLEKPVIAAVNGQAVGGGFALALACDIVVASEDATFSSIFVKRGLVPDSGVSHFLPRKIGIARACELVLTADVLDAHRALDWGVVNRVVPAEDVLMAAFEFALKMSVNPPIAVRLAKHSLYKAAEVDLDAALELEGHLQRQCFHTADFAEGIAAFLEKREPQFKGA